MTILTRKSKLAGTGFDVDLATVRDLPGMPRPEAIEFQVSFYARRLLDDTNISGEMTLERCEQLMKDKEGKQEATVFLKVRHPFHFVTLNCHDH